MNCKHCMPITECQDCGPRLQRLMDSSTKDEEIDRLKASNELLVRDLECTVFDGDKLKAAQKILIDALREVAESASRFASTSEYDIDSAMFATLSSTAIIAIIKAREALGLDQTKGGTP